tara:strand:+ start:6831 stop:8210 length:1380 start_codon:yes stop_codon:yes gene_type:complete
MAYEQFETSGMAAMNLGSEAAAEFQTLADMGGFRATKDMEAERREQERIELAQADRQRDMLKKAQKKQRKQSDIQNLLTLVGAGVGSFTPLTTVGGATIGASIGSLFGQEGGEVPSGKFFQSGWENLRRRDEYLRDQKKAIKQALKPSLGKTLSAASQGFKTGSTIADFLQSPAGLTLADAGKKGFEYLFGSKAAAPKAGAYGWDETQQQTAQDTPGLLGRFLEAKEKKKTDALFDLMLKNNPNYLSDFEARSLRDDGGKNYPLQPTATEEDLEEAFEASSQSANVETLSQMRDIPSESLLDYANQQAPTFTDTGEEVIGPSDNWFWDKIQNNLRYDQSLPDHLRSKHLDLRYRNAAPHFKMALDIYHANKATSRPGWWNEPGAIERAISGGATSTPSKRMISKTQHYGNLKAIRDFLAREAKTEDQPSSSFKQAFRTAFDAGEDTFTWNDNLYTTEMQ